MDSDHSPSLDPRARQETPEDLASQEALANQADLEALASQDQPASRDQQDSQEVMVSPEVPARQASPDMMQPTAHVPAEPGHSQGRMALPAQELMPAIVLPMADMVAPHQPHPLRQPQHLHRLLRQRRFLHRPVADMALHQPMLHQHPHLPMLGSMVVMDTLVVAIVARYKA